MAKVHVYYNNLNHKYVYQTPAYSVSKICFKQNWYQ